ncbi:hypothetical protein H5410_010829 [Solanum commersonii]|uniref:Uncharacterized protein n=1 Tax=Solanum commersonii TaxID=4109 RepID=A0A9J6AMW7_SOLCO|nr:hypothetical protein H5410_010829 [Solanum commersonii]
MALIFVLIILDEYKLVELRKRKLIIYYKRFDKAFQITLVGMLFMLILVRKGSETLEMHIKHLDIFKKIVIQNGLIFGSFDLSRKNDSYIDLLNSHQNSTILLQTRTLDSWRSLSTDKAKKDHRSLGLIVIDLVKTIKERVKSLLIVEQQIINMGYGGILKAVNPRDKMNTLLVSFEKNGAMLRKIYRYFMKC